MHELVIKVKLFCDSDVEEDIKQSIKTIVEEGANMYECYCELIEVESITEVDDE